MQNTVWTDNLAQKAFDIKPPEIDTSSFGNFF